MTDGEGRARFQYAEVQKQPDEEGQEPDSPQDQVSLAIPTPYHRDDPRKDDLDPGGGGHGEEEEEEEEKEHIEGDWCPELQAEQEDHEEPELEVESGPTLGVRIRAPIRDPDCISEEEEQQPYPALSPVAFFCLKQTTRPRNWCLRVVCNPYPFVLWSCPRPVRPNPAL